MKKETKINQIKKQTNKRIKEIKSSLKECTTVEEIRKYWYLRQYITPATERKQLTKAQLSEQILKIATQRLAKQEQKEIDLINSIYNAGDFNSIDISIEWKKSSMWGHNPTAEARFGGESYNYFNSGSISGCGYCKESTAFAKAVNQSLSFRKLMLLNDRKLKDIYGHSNGTLSGGVGVNCYYEIFNKLGYTMKKIGSGKTFDVYSVVKK